MHVLEPLPGCLIVLAAPGLEFHLIEYAAAWLWRGRRVGREIGRHAWGRA